MKIAILAATEYELELIRLAVSGERLAVVKTGIGPKNATLAITKLLQSNHPDFVIMCGLCGGLQEYIKKGDVIISDSFLTTQKKIGSTLQPEIKTEIFDAAKKNKIDYHNGSTLTVEKGLLAAEEKISAGKKYNACAVEMENFPIAQSCKNKGIPCISIRAVSDEMIDELDPRFFYLLDSNGNIRKRKLLKYIFQDPIFLFSLIKNARSCRRARNNYSKIIQTLITSSQQPETRN